MIQIIEKKQKLEYIKELMDEEGKKKGYYFCWDDGRVVRRDKNTKIPYTTCWYCGGVGTNLIYINQY